MQLVLFSVLGLSFFQPAQHKETHRVWFSPCFFLDPIQDNEQWWTWSPQSYHLNWNGGVRHPQVLHGFSKPVSTSHGWAAVLTDSGFQRGLLLLEKQAPFFEKAKGVLCKMFLSEERRHIQSQTHTAEVEASVPPKEKTLLSDFQNQCILVLLFICTAFPNFQHCKK